jgi:hypothetical protein
MHFIRKVRLHGVQEDYFRGCSLHGARRGKVRDDQIVGLADVFANCGGELGEYFRPWIFRRPFDKFVPPYHDRQLSLVLDEVVP